MRISDWSSDVCSSDLLARLAELQRGIRRLDADDVVAGNREQRLQQVAEERAVVDHQQAAAAAFAVAAVAVGGEPVMERLGEVIAGIDEDRKSTRLNSSH